MLTGTVCAHQAAGDQAYALDVSWQGVCNTQLATYASEAT